MQYDELLSSTSVLRDENMLLRAQANSDGGEGAEVARRLANDVAERWKSENERKDKLIQTLVNLLEFHTFFNNINFKIVFSRSGEELLSEQIILHSILSTKVI